MRAVIQRVRSGRVSVADAQIASIDTGLVILLGVAPGDSGETAATLAAKVARLRIFEDQAGKMNLSVQDVKGSILVVSQFTLFADTSRGNRPSFTSAAQPEIAKPLCDLFVSHLREMGIPTQAGIFGEHMLVEIVNDGPVTIWLDV